MALIQFPSLTDVSQINIGMNRPGRVILTARETGAQTALSSGTGIWQGSISFPGLHREDDVDAINELETFLVETDGSINTFRIPLYRPIASDILTPDTVIENITAADRRGNDTIVFLHSVKLDGTNDATEPEINVNTLKRIPKGSFINYKDNLFKVTTGQVGITIGVSPHRAVLVPDATGDTEAWEWRNPFIHARRASSDAIGYSLNPDFTDPVTIDFVEAI